MEVKPTIRGNYRANSNGKKIKKKKKKAPEDSNPKKEKKTRPGRILPRVAVIGERDRALKCKKNTRKTQGVLLKKRKKGKPERDQQKGGDWG